MKEPAKRVITQLHRPGIAAPTSISSMFRLVRPACLLLSVGRSVCESFISSRLFVCVCTLSSFVYLFSGGRTERVLAVATGE